MLQDITYNSNIVLGYVLIGLIVFILGFIFPKAIIKVVNSTLGRLYLAIVSLAVIYKLILGVLNLMADISEYKTDNISQSVSLNSNNNVIILNSRVHKNKYLSINFLTEYSALHGLYASDSGIIIKFDTLIALNDIVIFPKTEKKWGSKFSDFGSVSSSSAIIAELQFQKEMFEMNLSEFKCNILGDLTYPTSLPGNSFHDFSSSIFTPLVIRLLSDADYEHLKKNEFTKIRDSSYLYAILLIGLILHLSILVKYTK